ncbi:MULTISPECIES: Do family serine endopeptidase [Halomonadaceae]|uniref:Do family serine endopeptidase n=1 Tax=Halomonadaceae TaxID=28256 RepID=UPI00111A0532|nr:MULTISPECIES: Do family serine endopeptidase [Halomonas]MCG7575601.1 Do family serine endopeptidase [Halomonas sp. MMH1-48]MCG7589090.1 Do family serine endopeptidase [Halomonas sp. McD50-5]MCG7602663.1 Do family serine endopeptidase [Halomonas sp. MM17-34]MCG7611579.1 Do family serine endopeptidase [Halomonas sp. MM17-29]MCG7615251.1 Do family serine endopeptidase [Halomonas sp. McD50-4]
MHRSVLPYLWPVLTGLLLAAVILLAFPEQLPNPFRHTPPVSEAPPANAETPPALVPTTSSESSANRPAPDIRQAAPLTRHQGPASYSNAVNQAAPAVVNIYSSRIVERDQHPLMSDPFFNQFFSGDDATTHQRMLSSLGSGVIVSNDGYVLTNHHVINGADQIQVALRDGRETLAEVIGTDPESDLAVLRIGLEDLPVIELADSEEVAVGDVALAIGNPFGVGQTVTMGIISATGRSHLGLNAYEDFIQTDAAINPGNSGGALVNPEGALVGINTAIFSRSGGSQGIGFAIPANLAHSILDELVTRGRVIRGWLGIEAQALSRELAASFGLRTPQGVIVAGVVSGGPAAQAGLQPGDVLLSIDGQVILDARATMSDIASIPPGTSLPLTIVRGGERMEMTVEVGERPVPTNATSADRQSGS